GRARDRGALDAAHADRLHAPSDRKPAEPGRLTVELDLAHVADWIASAAWPLGRVAGLVMTAPIFTATAVPVRIRAALVVLLTVILLPLAPRDTTVAPLSMAGFIVMIVQVGIGAIIGFALRLVFEAVAFGGELVAT